MKMRGNKRRMKWTWKEEKGTWKEHKYKQIERHFGTIGWEHGRKQKDNERNWKESHPFDDVTLATLSTSLYIGMAVWLNIHDICVLSVKALYIGIVAIYIFTYIYTHTHLFEALCICTACWYICSVEYFICDVRYDRILPVRIWPVVLIFEYSIS